ncbi:MAG: cob(I)yrinic acid a,c-diamide adenosyltransferase [bacterium]
MSIATRTGDQGTTSLMHGRRVSKTHPRVQACGAVDELNAALGVARAAAAHSWAKEQILLIQKDLIVLMGELATAEEDCLRHEKSGSRVSEEMLKRLDEGVAHLESEHTQPRGWAIPGETLPASFLDLARTICRRAEREIISLSESQPQTFISSLAIPYLNRLSDLLWLMARLEEAP